ncbi:GntR family transcriptional regulator [Streptomyces filamentosus]|uniref:GntR family transcriptional regulator n=1 Tax=Streptomyces filamentosus TaxID=67294 RepID=A0A919BF32_STRFL|nr:GntR family transcriptional regulator [Streptomyces filamentosus]GHF86578.1 GntR family transcriptional regulator [Streptomyces filamentosus]
MTFGEQPAYLRVASDLREKIANGSLPPHTRLPSQARIREEYGVSDTVALEARKVLMAEGLVEGRSGSGTYVRERPVPRRVARSGYRPVSGATPFRQEQAAEGARGTWDAHSEQEEAGEEIAARLGIEPGDRVMRTRYVYRDGGEAMMVATSWEPLAVTGRTPVMLPEEGPLGGCGVVERMAAIDVVVDNVVEEVGARPGLAEELLVLGGVPGHVVMAVERTFYASGLAVETADIVVPADRYRLSYHLPVR